MNHIRIRKSFVVALVSSVALSAGALAGSLTPPGAVASTMHSLTELYDSIAGTFDSTSIVANQNGSLIQQLKYINANMPESTWGSGSNNIWNLNSGNVGIGTVTPDQKLEVSGVVVSSGSNSTAFWLHDTTSAGGDGLFKLITCRVVSCGRSLFQILGSASQTFLTIASSGNVGIGTNGTNPGASLLVAGYGTSATVSISHNNNARLEVLSAGSRALYVTAANGGNTRVGIGGTKTPDEALDVTGNITASTSTSVRITLKDSSNEDGKFVLELCSIAACGGKFQILGSASQAFLTIASSGNVGIGDTTPDALLDVGGTASISGNFGIETTGFYYNATSNNVGIANKTPDQKLDVAGNILASTSGNVDLILNSTSSQDGKFTLRATSTGGFQILGSVSATPIMTIASTNSATRPTLTFEGDTDTGMWHLMDNILNWSTTGLERMRLDVNGLQVGGNDGVLRLYPGTIAGNASITFDGGLGNPSWINNNGNFGIGTRNLTDAKFEIVGRNITTQTVASISAMQLTTGTVMKFTVPSSASESKVDYLVIRDENGQVYASLGAGGELTLRRNIFSHGATANCTGANNPTQGCIDYAESFPTTDQSISAGDVVSIDPVNPSHVIKGAGSPLGIVSTNPAALIDGNAFKSGTAAVPSAGTVAVALAGRVPVKLSDENGSILPGDHLTTSQTRPGYAMKQTAPGMGIGISLGGDLVFVNLGYWMPTVPTVAVASSSGGPILSIENIFTSIVQMFRDLLGIGFEQGNVKSQKIQTDQVCVGTTCVTEDQFREVFQSAAPTPEPSSSPAGSESPAPTPSTEPSPSPEVQPEAGQPSAETSTPEPTPGSTDSPPPSVEPPTT